MSELVGQVFKNRYHIEAYLGRGGMAEVYRAYDTRRSYPVAIKFMHADLAEDVDFLRRFRREAESLSRLAHENIVRFYEFQREGHLAFLVIDYVEGITLRRRILEAEGPLPPEEMLSTTRQVCAALHYAHEEGIIHRDVKPANIMLRPDGQVLLADFGIAKAADVATITTYMPGTPAYMSPEQCRDEKADRRSDIYSLGIVVYEMLTGRRPFSGELAPETVKGSTRERIRWEQMQAAPPPPRQYNPALPQRVEAVVLRTLAKGRKDRFPSAPALLQALEAACVGWVPGTEAGVAQVYPKPAKAETATPEVPKPRAAHHLPPVDGPAPTGSTSARKLLVTVSAMAGVVAVMTFLLLMFGHGLKTGGEPLLVSRTLDQAHTNPGDKVTMTYVPIPAGEFTMGSSKEDTDVDEQPQHVVHLDAFSISEHEVTNAQYQGCIQAGACQPSRCDHYEDASKADHPVVCVTWEDAQTYCAWFGARLPTEAEWEKAARGTDGREYPWGNDEPDCNKANYGGCVGDTTAVGSYPAGASPYGALDMSGNAWEWVADWYSRDSYAQSPTRNPRGPESAEYKVLRGGSWNYTDLSLRAANRSDGHPTGARDNIGFRCAMD